MKYRLEKTKKNKKRNRVGFFEKINKIDKTLARQTKEKEQ